VATDLGLHVDAEDSQPLGHQGGGTDLLAGELRMLVDVAPPGDDTIHHGLRAAVDFLEERSWGTALGGQGDWPEEQDKGGEKGRSSHLVVTG
jgi:hypothetical protein